MPVTSTDSHLRYADKTPCAFKAAFDETAEQRAALLPSDFVPINLDVRVVVTTVLGALPRAKALRDEIVSELPKLDIAQFDRLEAYAEALSHAHTVFLAASTPTEVLPGLAARAMTVRDQLRSDANVLARRGFVDSKRLAELKGGTGYLNVGSDIGVLVCILRERWSEIETKSAIQSFELEEAEQLHERITFAVAERTSVSTVMAAATDDRQRAFVLLVRAYDQARRAVSYLRWGERDRAKMLPSLWTARGGRTKKNGNGHAEANGPQSAPGSHT